MVPDDRLCDVLCALARSLTGHLPIEGILEQLVTGLVGTLSVDVAAVTVLPEGTHPHVAAASDPRGLRLARLQHELDAGPEPVARRTGHAVLVADLALDDRFQIGRAHV